MEIQDIRSVLNAHPPGSFVDVAVFNGKSFGACSITGVSPVWEMHPDTDEFFYIIEGEAVFILLEESGEKEYRASAGSVFVVPKGIWHKPGAPEGMTFLYHTPGESLHSDAPDPRESS